MLIYNKNKSYLKVLHIKLIYNTFMEYREIVNDEELIIIKAWVEANYNSFPPNTYGSGFSLNVKNIKTFNHEKDENEAVYNAILDIEKRLIQREKLYKYSESEGLPHLLYVLPPGTQIHTHNDVGYKETNKGIMVRFNVCIQKPDEGGRPIYAGKLLELNEKEYVICRAEIDKHSSEWVKGKKSRINISFGYMIDSKDIHLYTGREKIVELEMNNYNTLQYNITPNIRIDTQEIKEKLKLGCKYILNNNKKTYFEKQLHNLISSVMIKHCNVLYNENIHKIILKLEEPMEQMQVDEHNTLLAFMLNMSEKRNTVIGMFTKINQEDYTFKEIPLDNILFLNYLNNDTITVFDNKNCYQIVNLNNNIKDIFLLNIQIIEDNIDIEQYELMPNIGNNCKELDCMDLESIKLQVVEPIKLDYDYNNFLTEYMYIYDYEDKKGILLDIIQNENNSCFIINNKLKMTTIYDSLYLKYKDIAVELYPLTVEKNNDPTENQHNRFQKIKYLQNCMSCDVCYWIINEALKSNAWKENPYHFGGDYLCLENIPSVLNYLLFISTMYLKQLNLSYSLDIIDYNIKDIFIIRFDNNYVRSKVQKPGNPHFTLCIQINDSKDYKKGNILVYEDNEYNEIQTSQGDLLIYNALKNIYNDTISNGEKYMLFLYTDIKV